jgi:peroxiredoxin
MRKLDLISFLLIIIAAGGAVLFYLGFILPGQLIFTAATIVMSMLTKKIGAPLQAWSALLASAGIGWICGDWFLSAAVVLAYLAVNLRAFIFRDAIYYKALLVDPALGVLSVAIYFGTNFYHHPEWAGWVLPAPFLIVGMIFAPLNYFDRKNIGRLAAQGVIEAGKEAPDFSLQNYNGEKISLSDYKNKRDLLLIFVRGDWCPGCHIMLRMYERERKKFQDKNIMLMAIGPDPAGVNKAMVEKLGVEFAVLSDETMEVSRKYSVKTQDDGPGKNFDHGIPLPASFLVDKQGIIRYTSRADRAGEFFRPELIFEILEKF